MWLVKVVLALAATYAVIVAVLATIQTRAIFPAEHATAPGLVLPASSVRLELETADGEHLRGLRIPPERDSPGDRPVILGFGGNAWHADNVAVYLHGLFPDADVVAFHYRGYKPSTGKPSAAALLADAPVVFDAVRRTIGERPVVAVGLSIGASVAAYLAANRRVAGLILVSPFDSLDALVRYHYPFTPVRWLLRHHMATEEHVAGLTVPTALIVAADDTIVPPARSAAVRRAIKMLVLDRAIAGAGHNDIYDRSDFHRAMTDALAQIGSAP